MSLAALAAPASPSGDGLDGDLASSLGQLVRNLPERRGFAGPRHADDRVWCYSLFPQTPCSVAPARAPDISRRSQVGHTVQVIGRDVQFVSRINTLGR